MTRSLTILVFSLSFVACGSESPSAGSVGASGSGSGGGGTGGGGTGGGAPSETCSAELLSEPKAATTYYVAIGEPGADNEACDGLAPTDEGAGHCPFKDFSSPGTMSLLTDVASVRVEVRSGTYVIHGWDGLAVRGTGTSEAERVILSAYPGEEAVLDVPSPDGSACGGADPTANPDCVRQVVRQAGQYTVLQGLTIQNGLAYDAEVNGGAHHLVRCNTFRYTAEFDQRSDQLKLDMAADVLVQANEFTGWRSQAIDIAAVVDSVVELNDFHHPQDADGGATGTKFGSDNIVIRNNTVHDLGSDPRTHVFSLGGTGSPHPEAFAAQRLHAVGNRVWNVQGILAQVVSCKDCSVEDNDAVDMVAGILISNFTAGSVNECSTAPDGNCLPSEGTRIKNNRLRRMKGNSPDTADIFVIVEAGQEKGVVAEDNTYCASSLSAARFGWPDATTGATELLDFDTWVTQSGTDASSVVLADTDAACADP
jgi:hypothetical protein